MDENTKLENKMASFLKNTKEDIKRSVEDEEDYRKNDICRYCEKVKVTQIQSNFLSIASHKFSKYDCLFFSKS